MIFGSHVSIRDGYLGAAKRAVANQASAFQYFPKTQEVLQSRNSIKKMLKAVRIFV